MELKGFLKALCFVAVCMLFFAAMLIPAPHRKSVKHAKDNVNKILYVQKGNKCFSVGPNWFGVEGKVIIGETNCGDIPEEELIVVEDGE